MVPNKLQTRKDWNTFIKEKTPQLQKQFPENKTHLKTTKIKQIIQTTITEV